MSEEECVWLVGMLGLSILEKLEGQGMIKIKNDRGNNEADKKSVGSLAMNDPSCHQSCFNSDTIPYRSTIN